MKVLFLIDTLEVGGAEKSLLAILPRLKSVKPLLCHLYPGDALKGQFEAAGVAVMSLELAGKYSMVAAVGGIRRLIRTHRPDVIHCSLVRTSIAARIAGRAERLPVVNSLVSETYAATRESRMGMIRRLKHRVMFLCDRFTAPLVSRFIANSHSVAKANARALGIPAAKIQVVYRGRDVHRFCPAAAEARQQAREELGLPNEPVLLVVGRLVANKGHDVVLRAMVDVMDKSGDCTLLIAGDGPERAALERLATELGLDAVVRFLGTREDIPRLMRAANVFISASHYEGMPGAVVEALLSGLPVVVSDIDAHREIVEPGVTGFLFPLHESRSLAAALCALIEDPERQRLMGSTARDHAVRLFDIEQVAMAYDRALVDAGTGEA